MNTGKDSRSCAGVMATTLAGALFFFVVIGVFGQSLAIAGLLLFALCAIAVYRKFPADGASR